MPSWFSNLIGKVKSGLQGFGQNAKNVIGKVGSFVNGFGANAKKAYDFVKGIPVVGDVVKNSPIGQGIYTGLGIAGGVGNLLTKLGNSDYSGALQSGIDTAQQVASARDSGHFSNVAQKKWIGKIKPIQPRIGASIGYLD